jgi:hypothetical protein
VLADALDDLTSGVKSGWWASSTGVGTATMMKSASPMIFGSVLQVRWWRP